MIATKDETRTDGAIIGYKSLIAGTTTSAAAVMLVPNTYERYAAGTAATTIKFQLSSTSKIDYIALGAHNAGTHDGGVAIRFSYAATVGGALIDVGYVLPANNHAIMINFAEITAAEIAITFDAVTAGLELGVIYAGNALQMPLPIYGGHEPIDLAVQTEYLTNISETGQFLGRTVTRKGLETSYSWKYLDPDFVRNDFKLFIESARLLPFFIKWRPDLYDSAAFGFATKDVQVSNMGGGHKLMTANLSMRAHSDL